MIASQKVEWLFSLEKFTVSLELNHSLIHNDSLIENFVIRNHSHVPCLLRLHIRVQNFNVNSGSLIRKEYLFVVRGKHVLA